MMPVPLYRSSFGQSQRRVDAGGLLVEDTRHAGAAVLARHEHADAYACVVLEGRYEQSGRTAHDCERGSVLLHPEGHAHANRFHAGGARCVNLHAAAAWMGESSFVHLFGDYRQVRLDPRGSAIARLERELAASDTAVPLAVSAAVLDLFASVLRVATQPTPAVWLARVIDLLESDLSHTPSLAELGRVAGVHPAHLARSFQRVNGESVGEYLRRRRLQQAELAVVAGVMPLAEIALSAGFYDQAHFSRAFRRRYGITPMQRRGGTQRLS